jgi:hypothetical protein
MPVVPGSIYAFENEHTSGKIIKNKKKDLTLKFVIHNIKGLLFLNIC